MSTLETWPLWSWETMQNQTKASVFGLPFVARCKRMHTSLQIWTRACKQSYLLYIQLELCKQFQCTKRTDWNLNQFLKYATWYCNVVIAASPIAFSLSPSIYPSICLFFAPCFLHFPSVWFWKLQNRFQLIRRLKFNQNRDKARILPLITVFKHNAEMDCRCAPHHINGWI